VSGRIDRRADVSSDVEKNVRKQKAEMTENKLRSDDIALSTSGRPQVLVLKVMITGLGLLYLEGSLSEVTLIPAAHLFGMRLDIRERLLRIEICYFKQN
jgi:hypothetical protein